MATATDRDRRDAFVQRHCFELSIMGSCSEASTGVSQSPPRPMISVTPGPVLVLDGEHDFSVFESGVDPMKMDAAGVG